MAPTPEELKAVATVAAAAAEKAAKPTPAYKMPGTSLAPTERVAAALSCSKTGVPIGRRIRMLLIEWWKQEGFIDKAYTMAEGRAAGGLKEKVDQLAAEKAVLEAQLAALQKDKGTVPPVAKK